MLRMIALGALCRYVRRFIGAFIRVLWEFRLGVAISLYLYISISLYLYIVVISADQCGVAHWKASPYLLLLPYPTTALTSHIT